MNITKNSLDTIINDWKKGINIKEHLDSLYAMSENINNNVLQLINTKTPNQIDIDTMYNILLISNILYNNTSKNNLILEDGVYDLLVVKYKNITGKDVVGAPPIMFPDNIWPTETGVRELTPGIIYLPEEDNNYIDNKMLFYNDLYKNKRLTTVDMLYPGVNYDKIVSKRLKDTSHNNPELVGTLDKAKFVLVKQAVDKNVDLNDPTINILERDFFGKHITNGIIDPKQNIDIIVELKYDGVSIEADIQHQRIVSARSRGDTANDVASDLTPILQGYYFPDMPDMNEVIGVKFEAIMTYENLEIYSKLKERKFANCRTAIISWISSSDAYQYKELVTLVPLATNLKDEYGNHIDRLTEVTFMNEYLCRGELLRFSVFSGDLTSVLFQIYKFAEEAEFMRKVLPFMYDGIVVSYLDSTIRNILGRKDSVNLYSMAVKFNSLKRETTFLHYGYTIGQNGEITPMIYYNPVEFFGTIHTKSSGHSYGNFIDLDLRSGDIIEVEYRNDVMPYVTKKECKENLIRSNNQPSIPFPELCPCCNSRLHFTGSSARCLNFKCKERTIKRMANMMDKLMIKGFAEETMKLLDVSSFKDLMELKISGLDNLGPLTSSKFVKEIIHLKESGIPDWRLIGALGFTDIAANTWKLIFEHMTLNDLHSLMILYYNAGHHKVIYDLLNIRGIGQATVNTITAEYKYFKDDIDYIINNVKYSNSKGNKFIKVRFTGVRNTGLVDYLNNNGYDAGEGSVTKDTDILIVPSSDYKTGSKYNKAVQYGITIKPIQEFMEELNVNFTE